jgi:hypothetical protein
MEETSGTIQLSCFSASILRDGVRLGRRGESH